jgi:DNA-binding SARP family transcriptional activator
VTPGLQVGVLGPVEVRRGDVSVRISAAKQRVVLALLALRSGEVVSVDALVDGMWPGGPPPTAHKTLQGYVSALRRALDGDGGRAPSVIVTRPPGYVLDVPAEAIDLLRFERLWREGRVALRENQAERASQLLADALSLWRGEPLVDIVIEGRISLEASLLDEMRLSCTEDYAEAELACGQQESVVSLLDPLAVAHPFRERLAGQLMLALYRSGRQAEALSAYRSLYVRLSEELAVSPSPALVALERSILNHDPALLHGSHAQDPARAGGAAHALLSRADLSERLSSSELPTSTVTSVRQSERRVVSVLFCDLVDYTATAYSHDPEDVSRMLTAYHDEVRAEVERHGGVVEKFIGDAAVGLWGAPRAHEDDAERAVRAALALIQTVNFDVRVAVNTGEVLATVADSGEVSVVGDVINTAARLQTVAPVGGIVVGEGTVRATRAAITYDELRPVELKGIPERVPLWRVISARPVAVDRDMDTQTPFVGREPELRLLQDLFDRVVADSSLQLVTVLGEPGIGKSRLVAELDAWLQRHRDPVTRLRGRCLAYGEGIGFWPLSEVVKAYLGVNETHTEPEVLSRLTLAVNGMPDEQWLRARLAPLVGVSGEGGERQEVFTAWQRFFDEIAARHPLVLAFEDVHWADPAMLGFVEHLTEWSTGVSILVLCTARPELFEVRPSWAGGQPNATTVALRPLGSEDTACLVRSLLMDGPLPAGGEAALIERCGGNPLYAEEYARLLTDRVGDVGGRGIPDTLRALIAARIDTLPVHRKALLSDASVIGKVFWAGALARLADRDVAEVRADLHEMARKELIRRVRTSNIPGDQEYVFWHDLVHEVTYQQIPRAARADKHRNTARWIEDAAGDRLRDRAQFLAFHYGEALALRRAAGEQDTEELRSAAVHYLAVATAGAMGLDPDHASRLAERGLDLSEPDDFERAKLLCLLGTANVHAGRPAEARVVLREARAAAQSVNDADSLGEAFFQALEIEYFAGEGGAYSQLFYEAVDTVRRGPAADKLAMVLGQAGFTGMHPVEGYAGPLEQLDAAVEMARRIGDPYAIATSIDNRGLLRSELGDPKWAEDFQTSMATFVDLGSTYVTMAKMHLGECRLVWEGPAAAAPILDEAIADGVRTRNVLYEMFARIEEIWRMADAGEWDQLLEAADHVLAWSQRTGWLLHHALVAPQAARVLALRDDISRARETMSAVLERARAIGMRQVVIPALAVTALIEQRGGNLGKAQLLLAEIDSLAGRMAPAADVCRMLVASGDIDRADALIAGVKAGSPRLLHSVASGKGAVAEGRGDLALAEALYRDAETRWRSYGNPWEIAQALSGRARCLSALDRSSHADEPAEEAEAIFRRLGVRQLLN